MLELKIACLILLTLMFSMKYLLLKVLMRFSKNFMSFIVIMTHQVKMKL
jgi:hypothetical protein